MQVFDFDGVITNPNFTQTFTESKKSVVITGRSFEEAEYVTKYVEQAQKRYTPIYFNPIKLLDREETPRLAYIHSGSHKAEIGRAHV